MRIKHWIKESEQELSEGVNASDKDKKIKRDKEKLSMKYKYEIKELKRA